MLAVRDAVAKLGPRALNADPPLVSKRLGAAVLDRLSEARFSLHDAVGFRERKSIVSPDALTTIKDPLTQAILQLEVVKHPRRETVPVALFAPSQNPRLVAEGKATYGSWLKATPKPQFDESQRATPGELPAVLYRGVRHPSDVSKRSPAQVTHAHDTFAAAQKGIALPPPKYDPDFGAATFTIYWAGSLGEARGYAGDKGIVLALETAGLESSFAVTPASDTKGANFEARGFASYIGVRRVGPGEQK